MIGGPQARAVTIYSIGGTADGAAGIGNGQNIVGAVTSFTFSETFNNVDITLPFDCFSCTGTVFLSDQIGAGTTVANVARILTVESLVSQTVFDGLTLGSGTYFVGMVIDSGFAVWDTTTSPSLFTVPGTAAASPTQYTSTTFDAGFHPASDFLADLTANNALMISIDGTVSSVPIPAAAWLFGSGLIGLIGVARRRKT
jgi:hypothetical protein